MESLSEGKGPTLSQHNLEILSRGLLARFHVRKMAVERELPSIRHKGELLALSQSTQ